jgi:hypothetical protein
VLGLIWQLIKHQLLASIHLNNVPQLVALLKPKEKMKVFKELPAEKLLLRWVNYHNAKSSLTERIITNFGTDIAVGADPSPFILSNGNRLEIRMERFWEHWL